MTHKFCIKCGAKNFFDNPPKFCCSCGHSFNGPALSSNKSKSTRRFEEDDEDEEDCEDLNIDKRSLKKGWVVEIPTETFDKFKDHYASCPDPNFNRKTSLRPEFAAGKDALTQTRLECRKKQSSQSID